MNLFELMLVKCLSYMQHIIHIMQKEYIGHQSLEDQTLSRRNGCLRPSHSVTQPPNLVLLDRQIYALSFFYFLVDCNQDLKPCKIQFIKFVFIFYLFNDNEAFQLGKFVFFFLFFCIKNKWRLHTTYPKKRGALKHPNLFFESTRPLGAFKGTSLFG